MSRREADYESITTDAPATAIFRLNDDGNVTDAEGNVLATLDALYAKLENKVIAAFNPASEKAIDVLAAYCEEKVIEDVAVASTDVELINYAHEQNYLIRGIVLFEDADYSEERPAWPSARRSTPTMPRSRYCLTKGSPRRSFRICKSCWSPSG